MRPVREQNAAILEDAEAVPAVVVAAVIAAEIAIAAVADRAGKFLVKFDNKRETAALRTSLAR